jgi:hypothetical protein
LRIRSRRPICGSRGSPAGARRWRPDPIIAVHQLFQRLLRAGGLLLQRTDVAPEILQEFLELSCLVIGEAEELCDQRRRGRLFLRGQRQRGQDQDDERFEHLCLHTIRHRGPAFRSHQGGTQVPIGDAPTVVGI